MLRIQPDVYISQGPAAICDAVKAALLLVPRFPTIPDYTFKVVVVIPDTLMSEMLHMRHPADDNSQRDLMTYMFDTLGRYGLHSFVQDDDDEVAEAKHDAAVLALLRSHPEAHMHGMVRVEIGGMVCWRARTPPV